MSEAPARRPMWGAPVPLSNGLDTRPCKILDPPLLVLDKQVLVLVLVLDNNSRQITESWSWS